MGRLESVCEPTVVGSVTRCYQWRIAKIPRLMVDSRPAAGTSERLLYSQDYPEATSTAPGYTGSSAAALRCIVSLTVRGCKVLSNVLVRKPLSNVRFRTTI